MVWIAALRVPHGLDGTRPQSPQLPQDYHSASFPFPLQALLKTITFLQQIPASPQTPENRQVVK
jgi:hypothetical protein